MQQMQLKDCGAVVVNTKGVFTKYVRRDCRDWEGDWHLVGWATGVAAVWDTAA